MYRPVEILVRKNTAPKGQPVNYETVVSKQGTFLQWGLEYEEFEAGPGQFTVALVELCDGRVETVTADMIRFTDR